MSLDLIKDVLDAFPENVNPSTDKNWKFVKNWRSGEGLKVVLKHHGYEEECYMNGAVPENMEKFVNDISIKIHRKLPGSFK